MASAGDSCSGVADSAPPPESGPAVDAHVEHSDIYVVGRVDRRSSTQPTNHRRGRAGAVLVAGRADRLQPADCDECSPKLSEVDPGRARSQVLIDTTVKHVFQPSWAPDGQQGRRRRPRPRHLLRGRRRPARAKRLTSGPSDEAPAWSPNRRLDRVRQADAGTNYDLFAVNAATGRAAAADERREAADQPAWSPDGIPDRVRRAAGQREVGDLHDEGRRHRPQARHGHRDQRPGTGLVTRREEDRVHPAGAGPGHASPSSTRAGPARPSD